MQPLVQSALDAANRGENNKALELCKQALAANPNDVDAWLVVAAVVEQPDRKRQCLNQVLKLDPTNQIAREELLDMDRAAMGATSPSALQPAPEFRQSVPPPPAYPSTPPTPKYSGSTSAFEAGAVSQPAYPSSSSYYPTSTSAFESAPAPEQSASVVPQAQAAPKPSPKARADKPRSFRLPIWTRFSFYFATAAAGIMMIAGVITGAGSEVILGSFMFFLIMGILALSVSFKVELREAGIVVDTIFTQSRIGWNEISELKSSTFQSGLELKRKKGKSVKVSGAVRDYSTIIETLRQKRPDLFGGSPTGELSRITFTETKVYKKSFFMQYAGIILGVPMLLFSAVAILNNNSEYFFSGIFLGALSIFLIFQPFFSVSKVRIEPNRLVFEMFFGEKEFTASQLEKIWIKTVRGRYGSAFQYVMVKPLQGRALSLRGFGVGEEVLYGILMNWWTANNQQMGIKK